MRRLGALGIALTLFAVSCGNGSVPDPFGSSPGGAGGERGNSEGGSSLGGEADVVGERCSGDTDCDDGIDCTRDACDPAAKVCGHTADDSVCDDGIYCDGAEKCNPKLGCQAGPVVSCSDSTACTIDTCVEASQSCTHEPRDADGDGDPPISCRGGDCDDFDPLVSSKAEERCDNGKDDDCDGEVDESDCVRPLYDRCGDALDITEAGSYALSTNATAHDYGISCEPSDGSDAFRDIVVAVSVPDGGAKDVDLVARITSRSHLKPGELVLAATDRCGKAEAETACAPSVVDQDGNAVVRLLLHALEPGAHAVYVASDREADIELHVDFRDPEAPPANETCGTSAPLEPNEPVRAVLAGVTRDLESACEATTGELVYGFDLSEASDVRLQAVALDDYGDPVISLRDASCTELTSELTCRAGSPASLFARALAPGSYRVTLAGTGPTEVELSLSIAAATKPPATEGCKKPPSLAAGVTEQSALDEATDAVQIGCLVGAPDATYAVELGETSDVMVVETGSDGDTGAALIAQNPCAAATDALACHTSTDWPVRAVAHDVGPGSLRAVVESAQGKPASVTVLTRAATGSVFVQGADVCDDAFEIPADGGRFEGNTSNQYADYDASCDYGGQSIGGAPEQLLKLTLAERRRVVIDAAGSNYQTIVVVRYGDSCPGEEVADTCALSYSSSSTAEPAFSFIDTELDAGTYFIQIDGYNGDSGRWALEVFSAKVSGDQGS